MNPAPKNPPPRSLFGGALIVAELAAARVSTFFCTAFARVRLALLGARCGKNLRVDGGLVLRATCAGTIEIGDGVHFVSRFRANLVGLTTPTVLQCFRTGFIRIGDNSGLSGAILSSRAGITIGRHVKVGGNARIYDHDYHSLDWRARREAGTDNAGCASAPVVIGDDVFIGANAIILKGVNIGARSVVGAGAVVALKEIPPDSLVAGNPARIVKSLVPRGQSG